MSDTPKRKRRSYTLEDREAGLTALVLAGGNAYKATEVLEAQGYTIARRTLDEWRREHAERYEELQHSLRDRLEKQIAAQAEAFIRRAGDVETAMLERLNAQLDTLPPKELAGALRNISTSKALNVDKIQGPLRGRPQLVEHRNSPDELIAKLSRALGANTIDSTATEIETKELAA